jgi:hypothetical protein
VVAGFGVTLGGFCVINENLVLSIWFCPEFLLGMMVCFLDRAA